MTLDKLNGVQKKIFTKLKEEGLQPKIYQTNNYVWISVLIRENVQNCLSSKTRERIVGEIEISSEKIILSKDIPHMSRDDSPHTDEGDSDLFSHQRKENEIRDALQDILTNIIIIDSRARGQREPKYPYSEVME